MSIRGSLYVPPLPPAGMAASPWGTPRFAPFGPAASSWMMVNPASPWGYGGYAPALPIHPSLLESFKREEAIRLADRFCKASLKRWGANEHDMKVTLKQVARQGLQHDFNVAVRNLALQHGILVRDAGEVIDQELGGNVLTRFFKVAPRKACHDYLTLGRNTHAATPWEYRRYGMYRSGADFVGLCKRHPAVSISVIGLVSWLGDKYPFVGAASGIALMGWAAVMSAVNEYKATKYSVMNGQKAHCYEQSGENLAAIFMTLPGYHGITEGMRGGLGKFNEILEESNKAKALPAIKAPKENSIRKAPEGLWQAIKLDKDSEDFIRLSKPKVSPEKAVPEKKERAWVGWLNRGLFVAGLFDNVLLPFNWLADKLEDKD